MALSEFHNPGLNPGVDTYDMNVIAQLTDEPNVDDGLTAAQLKAKFDEGGLAIQTYINGTLKNEIDGIEAGTALADGSVTTVKLADGAVTGAKIADSTIPYGKLGAGSVGADQLKPNAVMEAKIKAGAVTSTKIADGNVTNAKLAAGAVTTGKIVDGNVTTAKLADGAVTTAKLDDEAVTGAKIAQDTITNYNIASNTIERSNLKASANDIFWVEYGTTYPIKIAEAITDDAKLPACLYNNLVYVHEKYVPGSPDDKTSKHYFVSVDSSGMLYYLVCEVVSSVLTWSNGSLDLTGGGGGTSDYEDLDNKPRINGVTLLGDKSSDDLGIKEMFWAEYGVTASKPISDAAGEGKLVAMEYSDRVYLLTNLNPVTFTCIDNNTLYWASVELAVWTSGSVSLAAPVTSVNGQTGAVSLTIPSTASDVGAIAAPASASVGDFLCYTANGWDAVTVPSAAGVSF